MTDREGMSEQEKRIRASHLNMDERYLVGVIDVIREDRNRLRNSAAALDEAELLTRDKIRDAIKRGFFGQREPLLDAMTDEVCELLSSKGARVLQTGEGR